MAWHEDGNLTSTNTYEFQDEKPVYPYKILSTKILNNPFDDIVPREIIKKEKSKKDKKSAVATKYGSFVYILCIFMRQKLCQTLALEVRTFKFALPGITTYSLLVKKQRKKRTRLISSIKNSAEKGNPVMIFSPMTQS